MKFNKNKWITFAKETATINDELGKTPDFKEFGDLMATVFRNEGTIESVLWEGAEPSGTEDRTWVRVYLHLKGYKQYADILTGFDGAHAIRIKERFERAMI